MSSQASRYFGQQQPTAVAAAALAVVPFVMALFLPTSIGNRIFLVMPALVFVAVVLSTMSLFTSAHKKRGQSFAWWIFVLVVLEALYVLSFYF